MSLTESNIARLLDVGETQFWLLDKITTTNFSVFAAGRGALDTAGLRHSLDKVQTFHPLAQMGIQKSLDSRNLVFVASNNEIPLEVKRAEGNWRQLLAKDAARKFALNDAPMIRACLYLIEENQWVFSLVFHHSIADGRSGIRFLKDVISHAGSALPDRDIKTASFPMHELIPQSVRDGLTPGALSLPESRKLSAFSKRTGDIEPEIVLLKVEKEALEGIRKKAREHSSSMNGVLGAVQLKAIASLYENDASETIPLNLSIPADVRNRLLGELDDSDLGLYITFLNAQFEVGENTSFWGLAQSITADIRKQSQSAEGVLFFERHSDPTPFVQDDASLKIFSYLMQMTPQASVLSNVGVVPDLPALEGIAVDYLAFTVHPSATQPVFVSATTFKDTLAVALNYDANRWKKGVFEAFYAAYEKALLDLAK